MYVSFRELGSTGNLSWATMRPTGEKGYVSFRELGIAGNLSWTNTRLTGEKGYVSIRELESTGNFSCAAIENNLGEGVCIIQGAGEYW